MDKQKYCPPYGMGKIQKLPYSLWNELKNITTDAELVEFINFNWDLLKSFISGNDRENILKRNRISKSSFKHIYGLLSSAILRAGGSQITNWLLYVKDENQKENLRFVNVSNENSTNFNISNIKRPFHMSPFYLKMNNYLFQTIAENAININDVLCNNYNLIKDLYGRCNNYNELLNLFIKEFSIEKNKDLSNREITKLVTKVDFVLDMKGEDIIPIVVDINDLHGGLQWIDDFREYYYNLSQDKLLEKNKNNIMRLFVNRYIGAYKNAKNKLPKKVLICLSGKERWDSDDGYNYKAMAQEFIRQEKEAGENCEVALTYMEQYIESLYCFKSSGKLKVRTLDELGNVKDNYFENFDMVVRSYRKITDNDSESEFIFTDRVLEKNVEKYFLILEDERLRILFDKRFTQKALDKMQKNEILSGCVAVPQTVGCYSLSKLTAKQICENIVSDAYANNIKEITLKLVEKTPYMNTSAYFFNVENNRHIEMIEGTLNKIKQHVPDIEFVTVDAMVGSGVINDRKIELRTLIFNPIY